MLPGKTLKVRSYRCWWRISDCIQSTWVIWYWRGHTELAACHHHTTEVWIMMSHNSHAMTSLNPSAVEKVNILPILFIRVFWMLFYVLGDANNISIYFGCSFLHKTTCLFSLPAFHILKDTTIQFTLEKVPVEEDTQFTFLTAEEPCKSTGLLRIEGKFVNSVQVYIILKLSPVQILAEFKWWPTSTMKYQFPIKPFWK